MLGGATGVGAPGSGCGMPADEAAGGLAAPGSGKGDGTLGCPREVGGVGRYARSGADGAGAATPAPRGLSVAGAAGAMVRGVDGGNTKRPSSIRSGPGVASWLAAGAACPPRASADAGAGSGTVARTAGRTGASGLTAGGRASTVGADAASARTGTRLDATGPPVISAALGTAVTPPGTRQFV